MKHANMRKKGGCPVSFRLWVTISKTVSGCLRPKCSTEWATQAGTAHIWREGAPEGTKSGPHGVRSGCPHRVGMVALVVANVPATRKSFQRIAEAARDCPLERCRLARISARRTMAELRRRPGRLTVTFSRCMR